MRCESYCEAMQVILIIKMSHYGKKKNALWRLLISFLKSGVKKDGNSLLYLCYCLSLTPRNQEQSIKSGSLAVLCGSAMASAFHIAADFWCSVHRHSVTSECSPYPFFGDLFREFAWLNLRFCLIYIKRFYKMCKVLQAQTRWCHL